MQTIYRLENKDGTGPYVAKSRDGEHKNHPYLIQLIERHGSDDIYHPTPRADAGIDRWMEHNEICGFKTFKQFAQWFTRADRVDLYKIGFRLRRTKVRRITAYGDHQILAIK